MKSALRPLVATISLLCSANSCQPCTWIDPIEVPVAGLERTIAIALKEDGLFKTGCEMPDDWWTLFNDSQLTRLIEQALCNHPDSQIASLRIAAAQKHGEALQARSNPLVTLGGSVAPQRDLEVFPGKLFGQSKAFAVPVTYTLFDLHLSLLYDLDVWGKQRERLSAAIGDYWARVADAATARLMLSLAVAESYFQVQTALRRLASIELMITLQEEVLELTQQRANNGVDGCRALHRAQADLDQSKLALVQLEQEYSTSLTQLEYYLADDFKTCIPLTLFDANVPPRIPIPNDLPLSLVARRPDIVSLLWQLDAAEHLIEVARLNFYPDINLAAMCGYQAIHSNNWFESDSVVTCLKPAFSLPIYNPQAGIANLRGRCIDADILIAKYNDSVLKATKEVIDGINGLRSAHDIMDITLNRVNQVHATVECVHDRLEHHLASRLDELASLQLEWAELDRQALAYAQFYRAMLGLIKALGGGFQTHEVCS